MSMTQTMSHPNDWAQFYRQISFSGQVSLPVDAPALPAVAVPDLHQNPAALAAVGVASDTATSPVHGSSSINASGRVSKPRRRRSRASRRTPTTLLSTDTTNFRAMVQQFTGGPGAAAHFLSTAGSMPGALSINFGLEPAGRAPAGPHVAFHRLQNPLQHQAGQRPVFGHVQDLPFGNMLSLDGGTSPEFPPRPPFMQ